MGLRSLGGFDRLKVDSNKKGRKMVEEKKFQYAIYEKDGQIARITLNRPEKRNALNMYGTTEGVAADMLRALTEAEEDDDIKVVILKGAGPCFCAGLDLSQAGLAYGFGTTGAKEERRPSLRIRLKRDRMWWGEYMRILYSSKTIICQAHGAALGAGTFLVQFCDIAIVSEDCRLGFVDEAIAGMMGTGGPYVLPLVLSVGLNRARELTATGRVFSGKEAAEMGLVAKAVPADQLEEEVEKYAKAICLMPKDGLAMGRAGMELIYDLLGFNTGAAHSYIMHTLFTNIRYEPGEWNLFKERRDKGAKGMIMGLTDRFKGIVPTIRNE